MNRKGRTLLLAGAAGLFAVCLISGDSQAYAASETDTINQGVYIGDVDVSGMTASEAESAVQEALRKSQEGGYRLQLGDQVLTAAAEDFGLTWENTAVCQEAAAIGKTGNIIKRYKETKDLENQSRVFAIVYEPDEDAVADYVDQVADEYDSVATEGTISRDDYGNFVVTGGEDGVVVDKEASVQAILSYLDSGLGPSGGTIQLAATIDTPKVTDEMLSEVTDLLGSATTYYGSTYGRNSNVEVGAQKLNGTLLLPGEAFSVEAAVTPFTPENGYELAPSYESGKVVDSYGGGICQVSTTLYNAVLKAELEVLERHNHTMIVTYVDPSKDAAIAEGLMDFRFSNNTGYPVYIEGWAWGGELTFNIYGKETRPADRYVEYISETLNTSEAEGERLVAKEDADIGYIDMVQSPLQGREAVLWKRVTYNGETTTEQVNSSTYQATPAIYEIGINSSDPSLTAAMQNAIATGSLEAVQNVLAYGTATTPSTVAPVETEAPVVVETPVTEAPVYEEPAYEEPVYEEPAYEEPAYEEPAYEEPAYQPEEPVYEPEEPTGNGEGEGGLIEEVF